MRQTPRSMQHATDNMQQTPRSMQHATDNMRQTENRWPATCNLQHATDNMQHATDNSGNVQALAPTTVHTDAHGEGVHLGLRPKEPLGL